MNKPKKDLAGKIPESPYAKKKRERRDGLRPHFEFIDKASSKGPVQNPSPSTPARAGCVWAKVIKMDREKKYAFLTTKDGLRLYLSLNTLERHYRGNRVEIGDSLECEIELFPREGRYPRVEKVVSVSFE